MEILKIENLFKTYGENNTLVKALDGINFTLEKGDFVAIIGASGSGKSSLLHAIGGIDKPTSGNIFIEDENIYNLDDSKLSALRRNKVGLIYQFYNLIPTLNVRENILLPSKLNNKVDYDHFNELINILGINDLLGRFPNELSGGESQRVAIARALINRPALLLADEPTGNLDSKNSSEIISLLKKANEVFGQTIIMVTHNPNQALEAKRIVTIHDGKIVRDESINHDWVI